MDSIDNSPTFRFISLPSMLEGVGSLVNLAGISKPYRSNVSPEEADLAALRADWCAVATDFRQALQKHKRLQNPEQDEASCHG